MCRARYRVDVLPCFAGILVKVHLDLNVKVDKDWRKNENKLKEYGYLKKG